MRQCSPNPVENDFYGYSEHHKSQIQNVFLLCLCFAETRCIVERCGVYYLLNEALIFALFSYTAMVWLQVYYSGAWYCGQSRMTYIVYSCKDLYSIWRKFALFKSSAVWRRQGNDEDTKSKI